MPRAIAKTQTGIGRKAHIYNDNGHFAVQLHSTVVYDEHDGKVTLNSGGWVTPTTVRYMNQALTYRGHTPDVHIKNGVMYHGTQAFDGATYHFKI